MKENREHKHAASGELPVENRIPALEIVLKCDSSGSVEAVTSSLLSIHVEGVEIKIIQSGVGDIHKSDILMAETGSRLIAGFQVDVMPGAGRFLREYGVEARLYNVIYTLTEDIKTIAAALIPPVQEDRITGSGKIIALFKSSRKGIIIGCEVTGGYLAEGQHLRIISAMGPVYQGTIESMKIQDNRVQKAVPHQEVGIKIRDFNKARIGDIIETYQQGAVKGPPLWRPRGEILRK